MFLKSQKGTQRTKVCGIEERKCYDEALELMTARENSKSTSNKDNDQCNCMPDCTSLKYDKNVFHKINFNIRVFY